MMVSTVISLAYDALNQQSALFKAVGFDLRVEACDPRAVFAKTLRLDFHSPHLLHKI
jgi:hypothetical protein